MYGSTCYPISYGRFFQEIIKALELVNGSFVIWCSAFSALLSFLFGYSLNGREIV